MASETSDPLPEPVRSTPRHALPGPCGPPGDEAGAETASQQVVYVRDTVTRAVKILVVGDFGVGKTTLVGAASEIRPLRTEEPLTQPSVGIDDLAGLHDKTTTTVALDFGRITLSEHLVLYLFGTPGQRRYWDMWAGLAQGAIGVLVLVDSRRLAGSFEVLDQLELHGVQPLAVAVNQFPDSIDHPLPELRQALDLLPGTPLVYCDARDRASAIGVLTTLVQHALDHAPPHPPPPSASPTAALPAPSHRTERPHVP